MECSTPGLPVHHQLPAAAAAKSLQSCPTLCDPIDGSPLGSSVSEILQARMDWVAFSSPMHKSEKRKSKAKVKSLSRAQLLATPWTAAHQAPPSVGFSRQEYWSGVSLPSPPTPWVYSNSCPLSRWCHPNISSSVILFSCLQSFSASGSFQISQFFTLGGQRIGVSASASFLPMNIQDWFPLGQTHWISFRMDWLLQGASVLISWMQSPSGVFCCQENKVCHCFYFFPFYLPRIPRCASWI